MYLIFGLGNPERQFDGTRHNIGFDVVDLIAKRHEIKIKATKFDAYAGEGFFNGQKLVLVKPTTYMNLSGQAVRDFVRYYKMPIEELIQKLVVICDETNLPVGHVRIRQRGTAGGHNGIKNILYHLGVEEFLRIRIGVGKKGEGWTQAGHVLSRFSKSEEDKAVQGIITAADVMEDIVRHGAAFTMNKYNTKNTESEQTKAEGESDDAAD
ncbi:MAG: aminoacyl-tRNA hydrolase [Defluviitaleaceae bacterium]|nr:aminoacyl-tRNA hydrolase [Defluviitaleaceae bacterium]